MMMGMKRIEKIRTEGLRPMAGVANRDENVEMMMGMKRIEKIRTEEIRAMAGVANISENVEMEEWNKED